MSTITPTPEPHGAADASVIRASTLNRPRAALDALLHQNRRSPEQEAADVR